MCGLRLNKAAKIVSTCPLFKNAGRWYVADRWGHNFKIASFHFVGFALILGVNDFLIIVQTATPPALASTAEPTTSRLPWNISFDHSQVHKVDRIQKIITGFTKKRRTSFCYYKNRLKNLVIIKGHETRSTLAVVRTEMPL